MQAATQCKGKCVQTTLTHEDNPTYCGKDAGTGMARWQGHMQGQAKGEKTAREQVQACIGTMPTCEDNVTSIAVLVDFIVVLIMNTYK